MKKKIQKKNPKKDIDIHEILKDVAQNVEKAANVKTVFGDPIKFENRTIIPVATVSVSGGGGGGFGKEKRKGPLGVGGGAGLHVESKPVGYIEITEKGAKFVPTMDMSNIAMKGIFNGIMAVGMFGLAAVIRAFRKEKKSK
jgi:uncharacterized spore protein YtfJ